MNAYRSAAVACLIALSCLAAFFAPAVNARGEDWYEDIRFLTWDGVAADEEFCVAEGPDFTDDLAYCGCDCNQSYCDDLACRIDMLAKRSEARGIVYDPSVTPFYQGVTSGGHEQTFDFGGKVDQYLILDAGKLGLWQGLSMTMHAETRFGEDVNRDAVDLSPVNIAMLYPSADEHVTAITGLTFTQAFDEEWLVSFGKFNALDMFYGLYPETGRGVETFMSASITLPLSVLRVFPLAFLGAGVTKMHGTQVQGALTVYDPNDCATTSGFDQLGDNGANIFGMWRFFSGSESLPGSHLFGFIGATGDYTSLDPAGFAFIPGQGLIVPQQTGSWAALYILQQRLWADRCNPARNIGLLSQWCIADEETCPFAWTGNVMLQAEGFSYARPLDTMGVGYFYTGLSNDFDALLEPVIPLHNLQGVELYYNVAVAKYFHLTADLQVIEPAEIANDTAVVFGVRGHFGM